MKSVKGYINFVLKAVLLLGMTGCVDKIPFEAEQEIPKLVIFGSFTDQSGDHEVFIRSTSFFGSMGRPISGANVEIRDQEGNEAGYLEAEEGRYILPEGLICGEPGKAYQLVVSFQNNRRFESSWEEMPAPILIENTRFDVDFRKQLSNSNVLFEQFFVDIYIDTPLKTPSGDQAFLRWEIDEVFSLLDFQCGPFDKAEICFYETGEEFDQLRIFKSIDDSQERLENFKVFFRQPAPNIEFGEWHYFNVNQYSIAESTYEYWERIESVSSPSGSIFDKLPARVPGNIEHVNGDLEVLGYFEVASVRVGRTHTTIHELSESIQIIEACNPYFNWWFQPEYCCFCWLLPNAIPRPDYWGE